MIFFFAFVINSRLITNASLEYKIDILLAKTYLWYTGGQDRKSKQNTKKKIFHVPCPCSMFHVLCSIFHVLCSMFYVPCSMFLFYIPCSIFHVSCINENLHYVYNVCNFIYLLHYILYNVLCNVIIMCVTLYSFSALFF
jgi:hypothetical protein